MLKVNFEIDIDDREEDWNGFENLPFTHFQMSQEKRRSRGRGESVGNYPSGAYTREELVNALKRL